MTIHTRFQSSPARGGGCNVGNHKLELPKRPSVVSILTRPWGQVQRWRRLLRFRSSCRFQSSPARGGGCNEVSTGGTAPRWARFNPHPPVGAGATAPRSPALRSSARFNPHPPVGAGATYKVAHGIRLVRGGSILTRPWGRVQPSGHTAHHHRHAHFNPHPLVGAGATNWSTSIPTGTGRFNPHPPVGAGATRRGE